MRYSLTAAVFVVVCAACRTIGGESGLATHAGSAPSAGELLALVEEITDPGFGGYYLKIDKVMETLSLSRFEAHEMQNVMRDRLEEMSDSFSPLKQKQYLEAALTEAYQKVVQERRYESGFTPVDFGPNDFLVVFDLDETLLAHWYQEGAQGHGTFQVEERDVVPTFTDRKTGDSVPEPTLLLSPTAVQLRPGVSKMFRELAKLPGFRGIVLFTAKEDKSSWGVVREWRRSRPQDFEHVKGIFTRNYLRYDASLAAPSKDLRIFDPSLRHVFLVDDNEGRVMQKDLNYRIPKFNADIYLAGKRGEIDDMVHVLGERVLEHAVDVFRSCVEARSSSSPVACFSQRLGVLSREDHKEIQVYFDYVRRQHHISLPFETDQLKLLFEPGFFPAQSVPLHDPFPTFRGGKLADPSEIRVI